MDANDLASFIEDEGITADIIFLEVETPTVEAAAAAVGVQPNQIGKTILFIANGEPVLVVANGPTRVNYKLLAQYLGLNRKKLKLAKASEVLTITGYQIGTVPPFGHRKPLPTLIENGVLNEKELYAGGGAINALVLIKTAELRRVTNGNLVYLQEDISG